MENTRSFLSSSSGTFFSATSGSWRSGLSGATQSPQGQDNAITNATGVDHGGGNILQFNCNGIRHCPAELQDFLHKNNVQVACLQETKLVPGSALEEFRGYTIVRRDRTTGGGGAMCLVSHTCMFSEWNTSDIIIIHDNRGSGVEVRLGGSLLRIPNVYIPPASSCPTGYSPSFDDLRNARGDYLIMGDFNAHHPSWYARTEDDRAAERRESLDAAVLLTELCFLNEDSPTLLPSSGPPSSPDVTMISGHLLLDSTWSNPYHRWVGPPTNLDEASWTLHCTERSTFICELPSRRLGGVREGDRTSVLLSRPPPPSHARRGKKRVQEGLSHSSKTQHPSRLPKGFPRTPDLRGSQVPHRRKG